MTKQIGRPLALLILFGILGGCGGTPNSAPISDGTSPTVGADAESAPETGPELTAADVAMALGTGGGDVAPGAEYLTDFLPNMRQRLVDSEELVAFRRPGGLTETVFRARVTSISEGSGYVETYAEEGEATGSPSDYLGPREVAFDDPAAWWRTLELEVEIVDSFGSAVVEDLDGASGSQVHLEIAYFGPPQADQALETLSALDDALFLTAIGTRDESASVQQIVPIAESGEFAIDPDEFLTPRFRTIEEFSSFASGPGEVLVVDPTQPGLTVLAREPR